MRRRFTETSARGLTLVGLALLSSLAFAGTAIAQTDQPKAATGAAPESAPAKPAQQSSSRSWVASCNTGSAGQRCRAKRTLIGQTSKKPIVTVYVAKSASTKKPVMVVRLPLGIYLPAGASVQFGQEAGKPLTLKRCGTSGCYGEYAIAEADLAAMLKGVDVKIAAESRDHKPLQYLVRAEGFPEAYAKVK